MQVIPVDYPPPFYDFSNVDEEAVLRIQLENDKKAMKISEELDLASWVSINQLISVPISHWIGEDEWTQKYGLHPLIKRAIAIEVERVASEINSKHREQERKIEMEKAELKQRFNYGSPNTSFNRLFH